MLKQAGARKNHDLTVPGTFEKLLFLLLGNVGKKAAEDRLVHGSVAFGKCRVPGLFFTRCFTG